MNEAVKQFKEMEREQTLLSEEYQPLHTLYHYTDFNTLLEYILPFFRLRLSSKRATNDPFENQNLFINAGGLLPSDGGRRADLITEEVSKVINDKIRIISFCLNNEGEKGFDYFGHMKPRMWAQYGDDFKGVCIALNLEKLISQNKLNEKADIFCKNISYLKTEGNWRWKNKTRIDYSQFPRSTDDKIIKNNLIKKKIDEIIFTKHFDFSDENEYRICEITEEEYTYLNISKSIVGISFNCHKMKENKDSIDMLCKFAKKNNVLITDLNWGNNQVLDWHTKTNRNR